MFALVPTMSALPAKISLAAILFAGCATGSSNTLAGAATMSTAAISAALVERAQGGCIAICTNGTVCNPRSGLCDAAPCRGRCKPDEHCEEAYKGDSCMPRAPASVSAPAKGTQTRTPTIVPAGPPPPTSGSPTIVPAAEQPPK